MRVIGLDPGLRCTGWGVIDVDGSRLRHVGNGVVRSNAKRDLAERLVELHQGLAEVIEAYAPVEAAVEASLVNKNPASSLKLGVARGAILLAPALAGLPVTEYLPTMVKKAVVGTGRAAKQQVEVMVGHLLPGTEIASSDAADALAVAICHGHHRTSGRRWTDAASQAAARAREDALP